MKQTAVEWLIEKLEQGNLYPKSNWNKIIQQAKEMEKEQIIDAFNQANALLISKAPEMLEMLKRVLTETHGFVLKPEIAQLIKEATEL